MNLDLLEEEEGVSLGQKTFAELVRGDYELADSLRRSGNALIADEIERNADKDVREWLIRTRHLVAQC